MNEYLRDFVVRTDMSDTKRAPSSRRFWQITFAASALAASPMLAYSGYAMWRLIVGGPQGGDNASLVPLSFIGIAVVCFALACAIAGGIVLVSYTARALWQLRAH